MKVISVLSRLQFRDTLQFIKKQLCIVQELRKNLGNARTENGAPINGTDKMY